MAVYPVAFQLLFTVLLVVGVATSRIHNRFAGGPGFAASSTQRIAVSENHQNFSGSTADRPRYVAFSVESNSGKLRGSSSVDGGTWSDW